MLLFWSNQKLDTLVSNSSKFAPWTLNCQSLSTGKLETWQSSHQDAGVGDMNLHVGMTCMFGKLAVKQRTWSQDMPKYGQHIVNCYYFVARRNNETMPCLWYVQSFGRLMLHLQNSKALKVWRAIEEDPRGGWLWMDMNHYLSWYRYDYGICEYDNMTVKSRFKTPTINSSDGMMGKSGDKYCNRN